MTLADIPMICVLVGLTLYVVLGGADFGAGLWQLATLVRRGDGGERIREHAHRSMGPVWEANHVWLIFVLTVTWTAYPRAFGAIASTLAVPLLIAGVGIVFRGAAYALRAGASDPRESALVDTAFSLSSLLTPFALGTMIGALVLGTVPVGNAAGGILSSWTHPLCLLVGALTVLLCAYMAAVYLAADAARAGDVALVGAFRRRALATAVVAGALAIALLPVLHGAAPHIFHRLTDGPGLIGVALSVLGGIGTLGLVLARRFEAARASAAIAVAGLIIGWALAQNPVFLPGLTIHQAAAPDQTLIPLLAALAAGVVVLFPSLGFLFSLQLGGRFDGTAARAGVTPSAPESVAGVIASSRRGLAARGAIAGLIGGLGFLTAASAPWAHIAGVVSLAICAGCALLAVGPAELAAEDPSDSVG